MKKYEILEHTADVRISAEASSIKELFEALLEALDEILLPADMRAEARDIIEREIVVESFDRQALLVDFLSDCLAQSYCDKAIFELASINFLSENKLKARLKGKRCTAFHRDIKAVTHHEAFVVENEEGFKANIVLDL